MPAGLLPRLASCLLALILPPLATASDWPAWRYDAARTASSPQRLPVGLYPQWSRKLPPPRGAWPDQPAMQLDTVTAYDTDTGKELWRFHTDGPIRYAPAGWEGRVYFTSDDGYLYC